MQINEYPFEAFVLGNDDLFDIDMFDGVGFFSRKVKWSTIKGAIPIPAGIAHLEFNDTDKTVWNNGKGDIESNTSFGESALSNNSTGGGNTSMGRGALQNNTTGGNSTAYGYLSMTSLSDGSSNTAVGSFAGLNTDAGPPLTNSNQSTFIGSQTRPLSNNSVNETVIGYAALGKGNNTVTLGNNNVVKTFLKGIVNSSKTFTVGSLPSGILGDSAIVSDATTPTYLGALTGGGSVVCPVWHNGTNWVSR